MIDHRLFNDHAYGLVAAEHLNCLPADIPRTSLAIGVTADSTELMPSLIELGQLSPAQSLDLLQLMDKQISDDDMPVVSCLFSTNYDLQSVCAYFARVQMCRNLRGERAWLRVHDPRVWAQLKRAFKPSTFAKFVASIQVWTMYYDRAWVRYAPELKSTRDQAFSTLLLDDEEWAAVERIGIINRSLRALELNSYSQAEQHSAGLDGIVVRAQTAYSLHRIDDLVRYTCLSWRIHPQFDTHPLAIDAFINYQNQLKTGDLDAGDTSVVSAFEALKPADWLVIREDLNSETNKTAR